MITPTTRAQRSDALPEGWILRGARDPCGHLAPCGCRHWYGCCERCPLPECAKTGTSHYNGRQILMAPRNAAIVRAWSVGVTIDRICERFELGERRVYTLLAQARKVSAPPGERVRVA